MSLPPVTHQALIYECVPDLATRRVPYREEHLRLLREAQARDELVMAGALGSPPDGALLVFNGSSPGVAENFARRDPYVTNRLVVRWAVRPWSVVAGSAGDGR
jgi:uncharacterized protein YciI